MKIHSFFPLVVGILSFASAYPIGQRGQQQTPILTQQQTSLSDNSFDCGSSLESGSSRDSKYNFFDRFKLKKASEFRCHSYPKHSILAELSSYITDLLKTYRDEIFKKKGEPDRIPFETCLAGYESHDVSPSIYFSSMNKAQMNSIGQLLKNQVKRKFPNVKVVTTSNAIAVVMKDEYQ